jgi:hypothetical protein
MMSLTLTITKKTTLFTHGELSPEARECANRWDGGKSQIELEDEHGNPQLYYADGMPYCGEPNGESHQIEEVAF